MQLKHVVPEMRETFGTLYFAGEGEMLQEGTGRNTVTLGRSYHLYSDVQRADDIEVIIAIKAGEKYFEEEEKVQLVNPYLIAEGYQIENRGFTNYVLYADDLVKVEGK